MNLESALEKELSQNPVEIPYEALSLEALIGVVENFILREGTDYGATEVAHEAKVKRIKNRLKAGDVKVIYDPGSETVTLLAQNEWDKLQKDLAKGKGK